MPLTIVRPGSQLPDDRRKELGQYLQTQWLRAKQAREQQVDQDYPQWQKAYEGIPLEEIRTVPFYKASNFVVKLIRMFLDTFVARTLNIIFATRPLYVCDGLPQDIKDGWELYLNRKALYDWDHYSLCRKIATLGNKNGTCIIKTPWVEKDTWDVTADEGSASKMREEKYTYYAGPESKVVPFEDFFIYPITANDLCNEAEILFHKVRFIEDKARQMEKDGKWDFADVDIESLLKKPADVKREQEQTDAGVMDVYTRELHLIECHLKWALTNDSTKLYNVVAFLEPQHGTLVDVYYNPYPRNICIFQDYRPFPREDLFFGESLSQILGQSQEEASRIHNERRDNSTIASSVCFKRRSGSLLPNPSTNWYPGKVWDLEDMTDLDVFDIGRNYDDMISQEDYTFQLAEKLSGIGEIMQGASQGMLGKRGIYNTGGTISVLAEGNQRQDTNIRDVRSVISAIAKTSCRLQSIYGQNDPMIKTLTSEAQDAVKKGYALFKDDTWRYIQMEVKASSAGANAEVRKANLLTMAQVLAQYGQTAMQMSAQLANQQLNPVIRQVASDFINMQRWMAARLLKEMDEWDATEMLPDVTKAIEQSNPGAASQVRSGPQEAGPSGMDTGGANGAQQPLSRETLAALAALPPVSGNGAPGPGMAQ